ncbi:Secreted protein [Candida albicans P60002]|nr:Secreted protein [Candida albicans P75063]KHC55759.1 Secreted protein [Candida albicans P60002]KHC67408.1 Secreted protein [Candida albicans P75010]
MVSFKSLITLAVAATSVSSFNLLHDDKGFAILPPTNIVLDHLKEVGKKAVTTHYDVLNTIKEDGEIVHVNLHTHETKCTGKYAKDYDNSMYNKLNKKQLFIRTIEDSSLKQCLNKEFEAETSECGFEFIEYNSASGCSSDATKYSCLLDVMKQQDATKKLKDMDDVPAQVRCYHKLDQATKAEVVGGACAK